MIQLVCILGFILCLTGSIEAQQYTDTISIEKRQVNRFYYQDMRLKPNQMLLLIKPNKEAYKEMLIAKRKYGTATFFGFAGGFLIGSQLLSTLMSKPAYWEISALGLCSILATIPFSSSYSRYATNAARIYNGGLSNTSLEYEKVEFGIVGNGVGIRLVF